jgi:hypothetical protein
VPKQNRPLVRDGRLQAAKKKRTDRSYLRTGAAPARVDEPAADEPQVEEESVDDALDAIAEEPAPAPVMSAAQATPSYSRVTGSMRAIQQQGVRKRREVDLDALAVSDTRYALHELRRIFIVTTLIVITLVVLAIVMR